MCRAAALEQTPPSEFFHVVVDPTMPRNEIRMTLGKRVVRLQNVDLEP
jgi:hypothetical protein